MLFIVIYMYKYVFDAVVLRTVFKFKVTQA